MVKFFTKIKNKNISLSERSGTFLILTIVFIDWLFSSPEYFIFFSDYLFKFTSRDDCIEPQSSRVKNEEESILHLLYITYFSLRSKSKIYNEVVNRTDSWFGRPNFLTKFSLNYAGVILYSELE